MITLERLISGIDNMPGITSWYLTDINEKKDRQGPYARQSPQRLNALEEHAVIESAISFNRIEGIEVSKSRIDTIIFVRSFFHDQSEEEVRDYRDALCPICLLCPEGCIQRV
ncbi:MAG TPA: hypothetical protein PLN83_13155 [Syntrophorhabdus sp.]|nr:hypothetical protein [Syntrophorhabdus sp.]